jgi:hypothetical protein
MSLAEETFPLSGSTINTPVMTREPARVATCVAAGAIGAAEVQDDASHKSMVSADRDAGIGTLPRSSQG